MPDFVTWCTYSGRGAEAVATVGTPDVSVGPESPYATQRIDTSLNFIEQLYDIQEPQFLTSVLAMTHRWRRRRGRAPS